VDRAGDTFGVEVGAQPVAIIAADDVEVEDVVAALAGGDRGDDGGSGERVGVSAMPAPPRPWLAASRRSSLTLRSAACSASRRSVRAGIWW
jgi:hypothetical protein